MICNQNVEPSTTYPYLHLSLKFNKYKLTPNYLYIKNINIYIVYNILLCNGKLTKAWGLGGLFKHHSKEVWALFKSVCNKSL